MGAQTKSPNFISKTGLEAQLYDYHYKVYKGVSPARYDIGEYSTHQHLIERSTLHYTDLKQRVALQKNWKILDLGCGFGDFVALCRKDGFEAYGVEIDSEKIRIGSLLYQEDYPTKEVLRLGEPQRIPHPDSTFDLVTMFFVMEHVADVPSILSEIRRVLKPGGKVYIICPNYRIPYEAHYALPCPTFFPKWMSIPYLRLLGRDPAFLKYVNFSVTSAYMENLFRKIGFQYRSIGQEEWNRTLDGENLQNRAKELRLIIKFIKIFKLSFIFKSFSKLGIYTPLIYLAEKK